MRTYLDILKFNFLEELAYPLEEITFVVRRLIDLGFLILFWFVLSSTNPNIFAFKQLISYFLISQAVADLTFSADSRFGRNIQKAIKDGTLSNQLIKPMDILKLMYLSYIGKRITSIIYAILVLTVGIYLYTPASIWGIVFFFISLVLTAFVGFGINTYVGMVGFYSPEAGSIKNVFEHIKYILSGAVIPLSYFPELARKITELTPFPILAYYPTTILQSGDLNSETLLKIALSAFWAIVLVFSSRYFWNKALRNYDGVGI